MKTKHIYRLYFFLFLVGVTSCNEDMFLVEEARDFLTPSNAYVAYEDFQTSLNTLYAIVRERYYGREGIYSHMMMMHNGTDMWYDARLSSGISRWGHYDVNLETDSPVPLNEWRDWYSLISEVNNILANIVDSEMTPAQAIEVEAETRFFRGFAYRHLVYLFGGVPLIVEQINSPRADFTRASKQEVLLQMVEDLSFASQNLPGIQSVVDGKVSNIVAHHYLAETYISLRDFDKAISSLTIVINDPNTGLMKERFGTRRTEVPGDVYWDLFREENQDRSAGNKEALWVSQMETDVPGGFLVTTATTYNHAYERFFNPAIRTLNDPDGKPATLGGTQGDSNTGGGGVSLGQPSDYLVNQLWESDFDNDIRNAPHNFIRDFKYSNPESAYFGMSALEFPGSVVLSADWRWYPWFTKTTTPENHPEPLYIDKANNVLSSFAGTTYRESYILRLAESYLLRAEAYVRNGQPDKAADDINEVRTRSNATPISAAEATIEYVLDERARELVLETPRRLTLMRMDLLVPRVRQYNFWNADDIQDYHKLWPIPISEIEANINANLEQNPGY